MTIRKAAVTAASPIPGGCCIQLNQPNYVNQGFVKHYPIGPEWGSPDNSPCTDATTLRTSPCRR